MSRSSSETDTSSCRATVRSDTHSDLRVELGQKGARCISGADQCQSHRISLPNPTGLLHRCPIVHMSNTLVIHWGVFDQSVRTFGGQPRSTCFSRRGKPIPSCSHAPTSINFLIQKPTIRIVQPTWGPRSGGTLLSIHGKHLTIGSQIRVFVGDQECFLIAAEETLVTSTVPDDENSLVTSTTVSPSVPTVEDEEQNIQCRTSKLGANDEHEEYRAQRFVKRQALWIGSVRIFIDNFTETYANVTYSYTEVRSPFTFVLSDCS